MTEIQREAMTENKAWVVLAGEDSEVKPTQGICDASIYIATDLKKVYLYDEANAMWREW